MLRPGRWKLENGAGNGGIVRASQLVCLRHREQTCMILLEQKYGQYGASAANRACSCFHPAFDMDLLLAGLHAVHQCFGSKLHDVLHSNLAPSSAITQLLGMTPIGTWHIDHAPCQGAHCTAQVRCQAPMNRCTLGALNPELTKPSYSGEELCWARTAPQDELNPG